MKEVVQTTKYFDNEYQRERRYEEAERALRQVLVEDEQARMRVEDLESQERDKKEEERLRLEEEDNRERERKTKHGAGGIKMASNVAASSQPHQQAEVAKEKGDAIASPVQHYEGKTPMIEEEEDLPLVFEYETKGQTPEYSSSKSTSTGDVEQIEGPSRPKMVAPRRVTRCSMESYVVSPKLITRCELSLIHNFRR